MTKLELFNKKQNIAKTIDYLRDNHDTLKRMESSPTAVCKWMAETETWPAYLSDEAKKRIDELAKQINATLAQGYTEAIAKLENEFETL